MMFFRRTPSPIGTAFAKPLLRRQIEEFMAQRYYNIFAAFMRRKVRIIALALAVFAAMC